MSVLLGAAIWIGLWVGSNGVLTFALPGFADQPTTLVSVGIFTCSVFVGVVCSILSGAVVSRCAAFHHTLPVVLCACLSALALVVLHLSDWSLFPAWYTASLFGLLLPGFCLGAVLERAFAPRSSRRRAVAGRIASRHVASVVTASEPERPPES